MDSPPLSLDTGTDTARRPFDTRIFLERSEDRFSLDVPSRGGFLNVLMILAANAGGMVLVLWLAEVVAPDASKWVTSAIVGALAAALVWLDMQALVTTLTSVSLKLDRTSGHLARSPLGGVIRLRTPELRVRRGGREGRGVVLEHGVKSYRLMRGFTAQEQAWVAAELETWLKKART